MAVSFINAGSAEATTVTIPANHQAGDLLIMFAFRDGSTTSPTIPAGWTSLGTNGGTLCSTSLAYKIAGSSSETSGTWTSASGLVCHVYRGQATNKTPCASTSSQASTGTDVSYSGISPLQCPGTSWVAGFAGHTSTNTALETPPSGMTNRTDTAGATAEYAGHDTNGVVSIWNFSTVTAGGTSGNWITKTVEIFAEQTNIENYKSVKGGDGLSFGERIK